MKLAIIGSRSFTNYNLLEFSILDNYNVDEIDLIISGGAHGADSLAEIFAKKYQIQTLIFEADWNKHGLKAGFIRNKDIVSNADEVIAFWDGKSKGTKNSMEISLEMDKELVIVEF